MRLFRSHDVQRVDVCFQQLLQRTAHRRYTEGCGHLRCTVAIDVKHRRDLSALNRAERLQVALAEQTASRHSDSDILHHPAILSNRELSVNQNCKTQTFNL